MNKLDAQRQKEIQQAEELLFAGPQALGFAKGLFQGRFVADWVMPYPRMPAAQQSELDKALSELRQFLDEDLDPAEIDRQADIPRKIIDGLGRVGVLGATAPVEYGGRGFTQMANCKLLEEIGRRCASTSVFVNAHHSIGIRALLLFGTREQKSDHAISRNTRHARLHDPRCAYAEDGNPRHGHGTIRVARRHGSKGKYPRSDGKRTESGTNGARFWPDHIRRVLHRCSENVF